MARKDKLKQILAVLSPDGTSVDFANFDNEITKLKEGLKEKIQAKTLSDVNNQLDNFRQRFDFSSLESAVASLEKTLDLKIQGVSGLLEEEVGALKKLLASQEENADEEVSSIASTIEALNQELHALNKQKGIELANLKIELTDVQDSISQANRILVELKKKIEESKFDDQPIKKEVGDLESELNKFRQDLLTKIANIGGGSQNRQVFFNSTDYLTKYTDINWKAGTNVTFTIANNNTTKKVDVTVAATGGGGGTVRSINSISGDTTAGSTSGTDYVYLCSGTLTLTLPTAVANTNLYTIKNVGTGVVTIAFTGGQTGDGSTTMIMSVQYTSVDLISDTVNWNVT